MTTYRKDFDSQLLCFQFTAGFLQYKPPFCRQINRYRMWNSRCYNKKKKKKRKEKRKKELNLPIIKKNDS